MGIKSSMLKERSFVKRKKIRHIPIELNYILYRYFHCFKVVMSSISLNHEKRLELFNNTKRIQELVTYL